MVGAKNCRRNCLRGSPSFGVAVPVAGRVDAGHCGEETICRAEENAAILAPSPCISAVFHIAKSMSACTHVKGRSV